MLLSYSLSELIEGDLILEFRYEESLQLNLSSTSSYLLLTDFIDRLTPF